MRLRVKQMPDSDDQDISPVDRDFMVRTIIGEAGNQPPLGQAAVASVILNRVRDGGYGGASARDVVLAPNQFEAWSAHPDELNSIPVNSPAYQNAAKIVDGVLSGQTPDPTGGATYFMNPDIVRQRNGGAIPQSWAQGPGLRIGAHTFFYPDKATAAKARAAMDSQTPDYLGMFLNGASQPAAAAAVSAPVPTSPSAPAVPDYVGQFLQAAPDPQVATATPAGPAAKKKFTWEDTWPVQIAKTIASGLTYPGDVYQGKATVPQSDGINGEDTSGMGRLMALSGVVGTGAIPSVASASSPLIDPATAQLAKTARDVLGIPVRGGQISQSPTINYLDSVLKEKPFSGYASNVADQNTAFNQNVAKAIGEDADKVTPDVMDAAKKRLGAQYEDIASKSTINADNQFGSDMHQIASDANTVLAPNERSIIHGQISNVMDKVQDGQIDGKTYQALIKTGSPLDRATKSNDSNVKYYAGQVKQSLLDALGRSVSPDLQSQLQQTNSQYKAMKTIEDLVEKAPTGDISPALLMGAVRKSYPGMAYGNGGPLADLARVGQQFLKEPPNSGTASRLSAMKLLGLGGASGIEAGLAFHDPILAAKLGAIAAVAGGAKAATNAGIGSILRSNWYANRLINSSLPGQTPNALQKLMSSGAISYNPAAAPLLPFPQYVQPQEAQPAR
jgi:hypothetical protein